MAQFEDKSGRQFPNWFEQHEYEKKALKRLSLLKMNLIPAIVALANLYKEDMQSTAKKKKTIDVSQLERRKNILKQSQDMYTSMDSNANNEPLKGVQHIEGFKEDKWLQIFIHCEVCAISVLQATINYLELSSTVGEEDKEIEYDLCAHFFMLSVDTSLNEFYHNLRRILWQNRLIEMRFISEIRCTHTLVRKAIAVIERIYPFRHANMYIKSLKTTLLDITEAWIENERKHKYQNLDWKILIAENRCYTVLDGARRMVAVFVTNCLKSLTSTLFHFCISKMSLTDKDRHDLSDWKSIVNNIEEDVAAATHKFTLISEGKMRPYGFVMKAALIDSLPRNEWLCAIKKQIRCNLQECISVYINWRFEFVTRFPRPIQAQSSQLSAVSNLFQSSIESEDDFKVIFQTSKQLHSKVEQRLSEGKPLDDNVGPWNLAAELEKYFDCRELEYELEARNKCLPANIATGTYKAAKKG